jgi:dTDP-4-amino-4,6-dideoxygalactose transaminase
LFVVAAEDKDGFVNYLTGKNIMPAYHYPVPCHLQKAYKGLGYNKGDFPNSEYLASHCISLPMFPELTDEEVNYVIETVNKF